MTRREPAAQTASEPVAQTASEPAAQTAPTNAPTLAIGPDPAAPMQIGA